MVQGSDTLCVVCNRVLRHTMTHPMTHKNSVFAGKSTPMTHYDTESRFYPRAQAHGALIPKTCVMVRHAS
jgi:hypothetical protein